jgi:hypothetical protein
MSTSKMNVSRKRRSEAVTDRIHVDEELQRWGSTDLYGRMKTVLAPKSKKALLSDAEELVINKGIPKPHRVARRQRPALIAWFCEHCPELAPSGTADWGFLWSESIDDFDCDGPFADEGSFC